MLVNRATMMRGRRGRDRGRGAAGCPGRRRRSADRRGHTDELAVSNATALTARKPRSSFERNLPTGTTGSGIRGGDPQPSRPCRQARTSPGTARPARFEQQQEPDPDHDPTRSIGGPSGPGEEAGDEVRRADDLVHRDPERGRPGRREVGKARQPQQQGDDGGQSPQVAIGRDGHERLGRSGSARDHRATPLVA